jgi:exopolysaccharide biosynthesis polyprenyl glycosylphosphotransferase
MVILTSPRYFPPGSAFAKTFALTVCLVASDVCGIVLSLGLIYVWRVGTLPDTLSSALFGTVVLLLLSLYITDAYRFDRQVAGLSAPVRALIGCVLALMALATLSYWSQAPALTPLLWRSVLLPGLGMFTLWAVVSRWTATQWAKSHTQQHICLFLGEGPNTQQFEQDFSRWNPSGKLVLLTPAPSAEWSGRSQIEIGSLNDLALLSDRPWSGVVVAPRLELSDRQIQTLMHLRLSGIPVYRLPDLYETLWKKLPPASLQDTWLTFGDGFQLFASHTSLQIKRLVDLTTAIGLLVLLSPVILLAMVAIPLESSGGIFYSQLRHGLGGKPFRIYKFRSMRHDAETQGVQWAQKRDPRITRVGHFLRLTRIDELPQLWNVLRGDMSLIGPRPERPEFDTQLEAEIPYYALRYLVKPGITGWAQVMYPYGASVEDAYEKLSYDLYYIKNYSIWLDGAIAFRTVGIVLLGKGQ